MKFYQCKNFYKKLEIQNLCDTYCCYCESNCDNNDIEDEQDLAAGGVGGIGGLTPREINYKRSSLDNETQIKISKLSDLTSLQTRVYHYINTVTS